MTSTPKLKRFVLLCLFATVALAACSGDDSSTDESTKTGQAAVEDGENTRKPAVDQKDSLYSQTLNKERTAVRGNFKQDYTAALDALKKEDYDAAYELLTKAAAAHNTEQLVMKYGGMRVGTYLPHYHLGMIEFLSDNCVAAMQHWDTSLQQGAIQKSRDYQFLQAARLQCEPGDS